MIRATLELLTMKAFQPDIRNYRIPFGKREINEPILGMGIHRTGASLCCLHSHEDSEPSLTKFQLLDEMNDDEMRDAIVQYARKHYLRYAIGLLSYDFTIELRKIDVPPSDQEAELLRNRPSSILGDEIESGDQYSLIRLANHPGNGLVFTYKQSAIKRLEKLITRTPLSFLQIGGGVEWALSHWLEHSRREPGFRPLDLVLYDYPTVTILQLDGDTISPNIFCRTDSSGALPRESAIVRKGLERYLRSGSRVVLLDISLVHQNSESGEDSLKSLLEDVVGADDLRTETFPHPLQLLLTEADS